MIFGRVMNQSSFEHVWHKLASSAVMFVPNYRDDAQK